MSLKPPLIIRHFDEPQDYASTFAAMRALTEQRDAHTPDELWLLEHHDVLTQGQAGKPEHILFNHLNLPVVQTDRGGQVTWHGRGQLVVYLLFDLRRLGWNVRELVSHTEAAIIDTLSGYNIAAHARTDAPGVYVGAQKIGSLGFKVRKSCSYHGLSLNIDCDLAGFSQINPCGYAGLQMVRLVDLCQPTPTLAEVATRLAELIEQRHQQPLD
jgi:lipoyl(octanoyl) transferase